MKKKIEGTEEPIIVVPNNYESIIDIVIKPNIKDRDVCRVKLQQGDKIAYLLGDLSLIMSLNLEPYQNLQKGKIVTKEKLYPFDLKRPNSFIKKKNNKVCKKDGRVIYSQSYYTYNMKDQDDIIQED
jgi:hypothetical protein